MVETVNDGTDSTQAEQATHRASPPHHIATMKFKATNRAGYDTGLRRRSSLTGWLTDEGMHGLRVASRSNGAGQALDLTCPSRRT